MSSVVPVLRLDEKHLGPAMLALNAAQRVFVHALVFGGVSQKAAAQAAGYSSSSDDVLKSTGHRLAHDPRIQEAIVECSRQLLRAEGAASVRELVRLRDHSDDDKVRLRAATELCDRAGLNAISQHNVDVTHTHKLSEAALDARILALAKEAGLDDASARKLLIDPNVIDAEYSEVPEPVPVGPLGIEDLL
jgi:phage terminase small subunit